MKLVVFDYICSQHLPIHKTIAMRWYWGDGNATDGVIKA